MARCRRGSRRQAPRLRLRSRPAPPRHSDRSGRPHHRQVVARHRRDDDVPQSSWCAARHARRLVVLKDVRRALLTTEAAGPGADVARIMNVAVHGIASDGWDSGRSRRRFRRSVRIGCACRSSRCRAGRSRLSHSGRRRAGGGPSRRVAKRIGRGLSGERRMVGEQRRPGEGKCAAKCSRKRSRTRDGRSRPRRSRSSDVIGSSAAPPQRTRRNGLRSGLTLRRRRNTSPSRARRCDAGEEPPPTRRRAGPAGFHRGGGSRRARRRRPPAAGPGSRVGRGRGGRERGRDRRPAGRAGAGDSRRRGDPADAPAAGVQLLRRAEEVGPTALSADGDERRVFRTGRGPRGRIAGDVVDEPPLKGERSSNSTAPSR